jgi:hypothetical protein
MLPPGLCPSATWRQIDGFRKGDRVPEYLLVRHVGEGTVKRQVLEELLHSTLPEALDTVSARRGRDLGFMLLFWSIQKRPVLEELLHWPFPGGPRKGPMRQAQAGALGLVSLPRSPGFRSYTDRFLPPWNAPWGRASNAVPGRVLGSSCSGKAITGLRVRGAEGKPLLQGMASTL